MTEPTTTATPPVEDVDGGGQRDCPECGHEATAASSPVMTWLAHRLRRQPPAARCGYVESSVESEVGLPGPCRCRNGWHGS